MDFSLKEEEGVALNNAKRNIPDNEANTRYVGGAHAIKLQGQLFTDGIIYLFTHSVK